MSDEREPGADERGPAPDEKGSTAPESTPAPQGPDTTMAFRALEPVEIEPSAPVGLTADELAAVHALPPTSALLVMQRGPSAGARFLLDAERTTAGRSPQADIFLDDVTVSRQHAEFVRDGHHFVVRDVGSLNGTYVNRTRIEQAVLRGGDEVQIGKYRLTFHPSPHREATTP